MDGKEIDVTIKGNISIFVVIEISCTLTVSMSISVLNCDTELQFCNLFAVFIRSNSILEISTVSCNT